MQIEWVCSNWISFQKINFKRHTHTCIYEQKMKFIGVIPSSVCLFVCHVLHVFFPNQIKYHQFFFLVRHFLILLGLSLSLYFLYYIFRRHLRRRHCCWSFGIYTYFLTFFPLQSKYSSSNVGQHFYSLNTHTTKHLGGKKIVLQYNGAMVSTEAKSEPSNYTRNTEFVEEARCLGVRRGV